MSTALKRWIAPAVFVLMSCVPSPAQISVGVDFGPVRIRIAPEAPPPPRMERRAARPSRDHVWIKGYWDRQDDRWAWAPGRWEVPTQSGSRWISPQYRPEGGAYRYEPGHWSHQRMEEGEDYSHWRKEHGRGQDNPKGHERDKGHRDH